MQSRFYSIHHKQGNQRCRNHRQRVRAQRRTLSAPSATARKTYWTSGNAVRRSLARLWTSSRSNATTARSRSVRSTSSLRHTRARSGTRWHMIDVRLSVSSWPVGDELMVNFCYAGPLCSKLISVPPGEDPNIRIGRHVDEECSVTTGKAPSKASSTPVCGHKRCGKRLWQPISCEVSVLAYPS